MGILDKINNRQLLVGLVGLGLLNAVLCLMYMMREQFQCDGNCQTHG